MACLLEQQSTKGDTTAALAEDGLVDIEATIQRFLADPLQDSMEFPRLSTSQRRKARQLAEQHAELTCTSYGLAAERRLHLFKRKTTEVEPASADEAASSSVPSSLHASPTSRIFDAEACSVSVKNTFIDGWILPETDQEAEKLTRSLPVTLPGGLLRGCITDAGVDLSLGGGLSPGQVSTCASEVDVVETESGPQQSLPELRVGTGDVSVRNTFVHFDAPPMDERAVQSMPHGMFGELLVAEAQREEEPHTAAASAVPALPELAAAPTELAPGTEVRIEGLVKAPVFNGHTGTVQSVDADTGRYNVLLEVNGRQQRALLKAENLVLVALPPCHGRPAPLVTCGTEELSQTSFPSTPEWQGAHPWIRALTGPAACA